MSNCGVQMQQELNFCCFREERWLATVHDIYQEWINLVSKYYLDSSLALVGESSNHFTP